MEDFRYPKILWHYWAQGWENAPYVVKECYKSCQHYAADWKIIDLDDSNIGDYIEIPEAVKSIPDFPIQPISDLIRILLLKKYGGVWIDATVFLNRNLTEFLTPLQHDFFCFSREPGAQGMSSWFLAAAKDSRIASVFADTYLEVLTSDAFWERNKKYFKSWRGSPEYFIFHSTFASLQKKNSLFKELTAKMPYADSYLPHRGFFQKWHREASREVVAEAVEQIPLYKFAHTIPPEGLNEKSLVRFLADKVKGEAALPDAHVHLASGLRSSVVFKSWWDKPERIGLWAGSFITDSDMRLASERFGRWHIYNFSSLDKDFTTQLCLPFGQSRMFIRSQHRGGSFANPREFAFKDDISQLEKKIDFIQGIISGGNGEKSSERLAFEKELLEKYDITEKNLKAEQVKNKQLLERIDKLERQIERMNESMQSIIDDMRPGRRLKRHLQKRYKKIKALFCKKQ